MGDEQESWLSRLDPTFVFVAGVGLVLALPFLCCGGLMLFGFFLTETKTREPRPAISTRVDRPIVVTSREPEPKRPGGGMGPKGPTP